MIRLNIIVEGQTEEAFVNRLLKPHLALNNIFIAVRCVETGRRGTRIFRGGLLKFEKARKDLSLWMKEDQAPNVRFTPMFDLYRLPDDFPGMTDARHVTDPYEKIAKLEDQFKQGISDHRFIPYLQLHEFEALLFADATKLAFFYPDHPTQVRRLQELGNKFGNPELINDGATTAPSKRIIKELPSYEGDKAIAGPEVASQIGLTTMREKCSHFNRWLTNLEELEQQANPAQDANPLIPLLIKSGIKGLKTYSQKLRKINDLH